MNKQKLKLHLFGLLLVALVGACAHESSQDVEDVAVQPIAAVNYNEIETQKIEVPVAKTEQVASPTIVDEVPEAAPPAPLHPWLQRELLNRSVPPWRAYTMHSASLLPSRLNDDAEFMYSFDLNPKNIPRNLGWDDDF